MKQPANSDGSTTRARMIVRTQNLPNSDIQETTTRANLTMSRLI